MRVGLSYDPLRLSLSSGDLCKQIMREKNSRPPPSIKATIALVDILPSPMTTTTPPSTPPIRITHHLPIKKVGKDVCGPCEGEECGVVVGLGEVGVCRLCDRRFFYAEFWWKASGLKVAKNLVKFRK